MSSRLGAYRRWAGWILAAALLGAVFLGYTNPHLMVDLANQLWACF
jgi:hypothetical protein